MIVDAEKYFDIDESEIGRLRERSYMKGLINGEIDKERMKRFVNPLTSEE